MGSVCGKKDLTPEQMRDKDVSSELQSDKAVLSKVYKLLLLGAGNSGKSTFFRQLSCIHGEGLSEEDIMRSAPFIHDAIVNQMKAIIERCVEDLGLSLLDESKPCAKAITQTHHKTIVTPELAEFITTLWNDPNIKRAFDERTSIGIADSSPCVCILCSFCV